MKATAPFVGYLSGRSYVSIGSSKLIHVHNGEPSGGTLCNVYTAGRPLVDREPQHGLTYGICEGCRHVLLQSMNKTS